MLLYNNIIWIMVSLLSSKSHYSTLFIFWRQIYKLHPNISSFCREHFITVKKQHNMQRLLSRDTSIFFLSTETQIASCQEILKTDTHHCRQLFTFLVLYEFTNKSLNHASYVPQQEQRLINCLLRQLWIEKWGGFRLESVH